MEAERERGRREEQARAEQERERRRLRARALQVLEAVTQAGGRLDLGSDSSEREIGQIQSCLAREGLLPTASGSPASRSGWTPTSASASTWSRTSRR